MSRPDPYPFGGVSMELHPAARQGILQDKPIPAEYNFRKLLPGTEGLSSRAAMMTPLCLNIKYIWLLSVYP